MTTATVVRRRPRPPRPATALRGRSSRRTSGTIGDTELPIDKARNQQSGRHVMAVAAQAHHASPGSRHSPLDTADSRGHSATAKGAVVTRTAVTTARKRWIGARG